MAPKSRRNRRSMAPQATAAAAATPAAAENKPAAAAPVKAGTVESFVTTANFARDIKWTAIVTLIIAVLIVLALVVIPH
jgi:hypothetical protein